MRPLQCKPRPAPPQLSPSPWGCYFPDDKSEPVACTTEVAPFGEYQATATTYTNIPRAAITMSPLTILGVERTKNNSKHASDVSDKLFVFPQAWVILPKDGTPATCPSPSSTLATFAVANIISAIVSFILGNRNVVRKLTCGLFGRHGTPHWTWAVLWLIPAGMHVAANAAVAAVIHAHPDFTATFSLADLTVLFFTRPRAGWIPTVIAGDVHWD